MPLLRVEPIYHTNTLFIISNIEEMHVTLDLDLTDKVGQIRNTTSAIVWEKDLQTNRQ